MFAHDLCHSQIEYFSLRLLDPAARRGILSTYIEKTERSLRLAGVVAPTPRRAIPQIFNLQSWLVRVGVILVAMDINCHRCYRLSYYLKRQIKFTLISDKHQYRIPNTT